jgi:P-type Ca2+ transporter type 2C
MNGLSEVDVIALQKEHGKNEIVDQKKTSQLTVFIAQFRNPIVYLLIAASIVSFALKEYIDGGMIAAIIILNGIFSYVQEFKAEKAIQALKKMVTTKARVMRDGKQQLIDASTIVPNDIIVLEQGDRVPADAILLESKNLEVNESILTGESVPVEKHAQKEQQNTLLLGTHVTRGHCIARVTHIGMKTRFGTIAASLSTIEQQDTPLEKKVSSLGKQLGILGVSSSVLLFLFGLLRNHPLIEMLFTSISIAVAAVPEGLPAVITITLALGTQRMVKKRAILRKLSAMEALGSVSIIATDKTGTLTKNEMRVTSYWTHAGRQKAQVISRNETVLKMLHISVLCNNANIQFQKDTPILLGDPTETALLLFAHQYGINKKTAMGVEGEIVEEFDFDAGIKAMSVVYKPDGGNEIEILTKGAPEVILKKSIALLTQDGVKKLTTAQIHQIEEECVAMASKGLRVMGFGYRRAHHITKDRHTEENDLVFVGLVGIEDPPREEVKEAIQKAARAGIRTIMITGDNPLTAKSVGQEIGLIAEDGGVITGSELATMSDAEVQAVLEHTSIYARTSPEDKVRIVTLLQKLGHVVSVTGDGVNDALALKQADVGVAMGITGSDVSKGAADMIVTDDNYATIVSAVEEGRTIYDNMKASIKYLLGCNIGEVLSILIATLFGWPMILTPLQILFINLVTDGLPALGLSAIPAHKSIMQRKPSKNKNLFNKYDYRWLIETASISTIVILAAFSIGYMGKDLILAQTLTFLASVAVQQYIYLDLQARNYSIVTSIFKNKIFLPLLGIIPLIIQIKLLYVGFFEDIFTVVAIPLHLLITILAVASIAIISSELRKKFLQKWFYPHHVVKDQ